jgi:hypothetical protein
MGGLPASALAVMVFTVASLPSQIFGVGIYPLLAEMLPDHHRIHVFAVRAIISSCIISVVTLVAGQWLNRAPFPGNYQVVYAVAWACGMMSVTHLVLASRTIQKRQALSLCQRQTDVLAILALMARAERLKQSLALAAI